MLCAEFSELWHPEKKNTKQSQRHDHDAMGIRTNGMDVLGGKGREIYVLSKFVNRGVAPNNAR